MSSLAGPDPRALAGPLRPPLTVTAVVATVTVVLVGILHAGESVAHGVDAAATAAILDADSPARTVALMVDFGAEPAGAAILVTLLAGLCLLLRRRRLAVLAVACLVPAAVTTALKPVFGRTINGEHLSYPSGHTALATALAFVFALLAVDLFRAGRTAGVLVALGAPAVAGAEMAWSQVALGAHYATDTLGGFATALAVMPVLALLVDLAAERRPVSRQASPG
ncbi:undecaprenyl-diphosphatase [Prauserella shujinwangii]|uniref:Undecaprenyl-diphosphatase n=1 Tax=Prauserella shujinwangii TaxID=1453103 RepID=A0A2T0LQR5_9PSEU|nr:phosphatase PAP2 family protein [Prauserella shujinwangii]PRX45622.1 undecaprenyl-diphosphatase [Prauserella shujinwangii]